MLPRILRFRDALLTIAILLLSSPLAWAANDPPDAAVNSTNQLAGVPASAKLTFVMWITLAIIGFGLIVLGGITAAFWTSVNKKTDEFVRIFAISLVVVASLVLIVAGYADSQIAPAFGLFGSIIGYIFGRVDRPAPPPPAATEGTPPAAGQP